MEIPSWLWLRQVTPSPTPPPCVEEGRSHPFPRAQGRGPGGRGSSWTTLLGVLVLCSLLLVACDSTPSITIPTPKPTTPPTTAACHDRRRRRYRPRRHRRQSLRLPRPRLRRSCTLLRRGKLPRPGHRPPPSRSRAAPVPTPEPARRPDQDRLLIAAHRQQQGADRLDCRRPSGWLLTRPATRSTAHQWSTRTGTTRRPRAAPGMLRRRTRTPIGPSRTPTSWCTSARTTPGQRRSRSRRSTTPIS